MERQDEITAVRLLGEQIGYGNVMDIASKLWKQDFMLKGLDTEGCHVPVIVTDKHIYCDDKTYINAQYVTEWHRFDEMLPDRTMDVLLRWEPTEDESCMGLDGHYSHNIWFGDHFAYTVLNFTHWAEIRFDK